MAQAKSLIRSQEETLKQRDEERRQLKSKMTAAELQARGKEAQIRNLNVSPFYTHKFLIIILLKFKEQINNLRTDLKNAHDELRGLRDRNEGSESNRYQLESKLRDHEGEIQRLQLRVTNYETERQTANEKVKELEGQLKLSESKYMDVREDKEKLSRDLLRAEAIENDLRKSLDQYSRAESTSKHFLNSLLLEKLDNRFPKKM